MHTLPRSCCFSGMLTIVELTRCQPAGHICVQGNWQPTMVRSGVSSGCGGSGGRRAWDGVAGGEGASRLRLLSPTLQRRIRFNTPNNRSLGCRCRKGCSITPTLQDTGTTVLAMSMWV